MLSWPQDIAVVPFLVLLPLVVQLQSSGVGDPVAALADAASGAVAAAQTNPASLVAMLGPTALKTCAGLAVLLLGGRVLLRRVFELVAQVRRYADMWLRRFRGGGACAFGCGAVRRCVRGKQACVCVRACVSRVTTARRLWACAC